MQRRDAIAALLASSTGLLLPSWAVAAVLAHGNKVSIRCLARTRGPKYLAGRRRDGAVGLAPELSRKFSGTKWQMHRAGDGVFAFKCLGASDGPQWLDGRTADGSIGLAPHTNPPFTGTRWKLLSYPGEREEIVALQCLAGGRDPLWLDGRPGDGSVALARSTEPPFIGTKWEIALYPVRIDPGTELVPAPEG